MTTNGTPSQTANPYNDVMREYARQKGEVANKYRRANAALDDEEHTAVRNHIKDLNAVKDLFDKDVAKADNVVAYVSLAEAIHKTTLTEIACRRRALKREYD